jgi:arylsulfatase A
MKHGSLNALSLLVLGLFLPNAPFRGHAAQTPPPNIILMMADDMGMGDTSAYQDFSGNDDSVQVHTPNMDRLARMGVRFTLANTPSSRCTTTRYSLLTGRYSWRSRMKHWVLFGAQGDPMIERDRPTIATMLHEAGYGTAIVGKWHMGLRFSSIRWKACGGMEGC